MTPSSPLSPIKFGRGGIAKKRFRRSSNLRSNATASDAENHPNAATTTTTTTTVKKDDAATDTTDTSTDTWWTDKRDHFHHWLRCNPLRLGITSDSVDFIKQQLQRGDEQPDRQATCWRHCVVELISTGVPGLDDELLSIAEIPAKKYDNIDMRALLGTTSSVVAGKASTPAFSSLQEMPLEVLHTEILRLANERQTFLETLKEQDNTTTAAVEKEQAALNACSVAHDALKSSEELQTAQMKRIETLSHQVKQLKKQIANGSAMVAAAEMQANVAGSGIAAVKALSTADARPSSADAVRTSIDINSMTMLERQQHFSKLRTQKRDLALAKKKKDEDDEFKKSAEERKAAKQKRGSQWEHIRSRLHDVVETGSRRKSEVGVPKAVSKVSKATKEGSGSGNNGGSGNSGSNKKSTGWKKLLKLKADGKLTRKKKKKGKKEEKKSGGGSSLLDMCQAMLKKKTATDIANKKAMSETTEATTAADLIGQEEPPPTPTPNHVDASIGLQPPVASPFTARAQALLQQGETSNVEMSNATTETETAAATTTASTTTTEPTTTTNEVASLPKDVFSSEGFFDKFGTNNLKGKHVIQDSMPFNIDTFFRKRDKHSGRDGVSLLMARKDDDHGTQEAIAVFFDRTKFTEEEAAEWWLHNRIRFPYREDGK